MSIEEITTLVDRLEEELLHGEDTDDLIKASRRHVASLRTILKSYNENHAGPLPFPTVPTVGVLLTPIWKKASSTPALLAIRRGVPGYGYGKIALSGGFQNPGESWGHAALRETVEEAFNNDRTSKLTSGFENLAVASVVNVVSVGQTESEASGTGRTLTLVFSLLHYPVVHEEDLPAFVPNAEVLERLILTECPKAEDIAFPSHAAVIRNFFAQTYHGYPVTRP